MLKISNQLYRTNKWFLNIHSMEVLQQDGPPHSRNYHLPTGLRAFELIAEVGRSVSRSATVFPYDLKNS